MIDIKLIVIICSILVVAANKLIPKEHRLYKVANYVIRGVILVLIGIYLYNRFSHT